MVRNLRGINVKNSSHEQREYDSWQHTVLGTIFKVAPYIWYYVKCFVIRIFIYVCLWPMPYLFIYIL